MESWRKVWREGLEPLLSTPSLEALQQALTTDDPRLLQGAQWFFWGRLVYAPLYWAGIPYVRTAAWASPASSSFSPWRVKVAARPASLRRSSSSTSGRSAAAMRSKRRDRSVLASFS